MLGAFLATSYQYPPQGHSRLKTPSENCPIHLSLIGSSAPAGNTMPLVTAVDETCRSRAQARREGGR